VAQRERQAHVVGHRAVAAVEVSEGPRRAQHPVVPPHRERSALDAAVDTVRWVAGFVFPDFEHDHEYVALQQPGTYAIERGRLVSSAGLDIVPAQFEEHVVEEHVAHSTALHARIRERGRYLVGPLARYSLNGRWLSQAAREAARDAGLGEVCRNPFQSIVVRAVETVYAVEEALRILETYEPPDPPYLDVPPRAGVGHGITEAPRGILYHRYELDADGIVRSARIVPPTAQSQPSIEDDLRRFVDAHLDMPDDELTLRCEQTIRNYDPCISCATHFLRLTVDRR
jgi:coenzyme F420-reducing hydrogenase alpha subunit